MLKAQIQGNLVFDPELKEIFLSGDKEHKKKVCVLTVASNRPGREAPCVLRVEIWGKAAENCEKYLSKGSGVFAAGDLDIDLYEKDGERRVAVKMVNAEIEFTDRKAKS